jgi:MbtH protein
MTNPFDDEERNFLVLTNRENQHSLWPEGMNVPDGWTVVHGPASRDLCVTYVDDHWTDMRPASLATAMEQDANGK